MTTPPPPAELWVLSGLHRPRGKRHDHPWIWAVAATAIGAMVARRSKAKTQVMAATVNPPPLPRFEAGYCGFIPFWPVELGLFMVAVGDGHQKVFLRGSPFSPYADGEDDMSLLEGPLT